MTVRPVVQAVVRGIVQGISGGNGGFNPLVFHALDDVDGSFVADVITGVGNIAEARTSTNYAPNASGVWTAYTSGQAIQEYANGKWWVKGEPAHTNSQIYSNDLTNAEWTASNVTVAKDAVGLTGAANSACTLTATAANGTVIANAITAASATHVTRWFIKRKTGTGTVELTLDNGATWNDITTALDAASGWYYEPTAQAALTNPQIGIRIVTSGDAVEVGNAECHLATTTAAVRGSSPIFTSGSAASTVASAMSFSDQNHSDDQGLWTCDVYEYDTTDVDRTYLMTGISGRFFRRGTSDARANSFDGTTTVYTPNLSVGDNSLALAYGGSDRRMFANGSGGAASAYDGNFAKDLSKIAVVSSSTGGAPPITMFIRNIRRYNLPYASAVTKAEEITA